MTPNHIRQANYRKRRSEQLERRGDALKLIAQELADSKTEKGKRLHDLALEALG